MSGWQVGDLALCVDDKFFPNSFRGVLTDLFYGKRDPRKGSVSRVAEITTGDTRGKKWLALLFEGYDVYFYEASCFRRIPPPSDELIREVKDELRRDQRVPEGV